MSLLITEPGTRILYILLSTLHEDMKQRKYYSRIKLLSGIFRKFSSYGHNANYKIWLHKIPVIVPELGSNSDSNFHRILLYGVHTNAIQLKIEKSSLVLKCGATNLHLTVSLNKELKSSQSHEAT
jgi:hypothetical protein